MLAELWEKLAATDRSVDDYLTFDRHIAPDMVVLQDGTHVAVVRLAGRPLGLLDEPERRAERRHRHAVVRALADLNITIYEHLVCHDRVEPFRPTGFRNPYPRLLAEDYHRATDAGLMEREWFLTIMAHPTGLDGALGRLFRRAPQEDERLAQQVEDRCKMVERALADYQPRRLGVRVQAGIRFSEIAEAMRLVLYGRWQPVPMTDGPLAGAIYSDRVICGLRGFQIDDPAGPTLGVIFGLREYPEKATPRLLDALLGTASRLVMTNSFRFMTRAQVTGKLSLRETQMQNAQDRATSLQDGLAAAMDEVASGRGIMGDHHWSVTVHVDGTAGDHQENLRRLTRAASDMRALLVNAGLAVTPEALGCEAAFWAQSPGSPKWLRARHGPISAYNFASFSSLGGTPRGGGKGHWGAPILRFRTSTGTAHDYHLHVEDVGHTLIFGPSGKGKTVILGLLAALMEPAVGAKGGVVAILDADGSNELTVRACGGYYAKIRRGQASGMAPFKALRNTPEARAWLLEFTLGLIMADGAPAPSPQQIERLDRGIAFLLRQRPEIRSFAALRQFADHAEGGCGERLARWCRGGSLGWAFDGDEDLIRIDAGLVGIDNSEILSAEAETVRAPMAAYQLFRVGEKVGTGLPGAVLVDEAHAYLPDDRFAAGFERFVTRLRKGNGALVMAMQQPQAIIRHRIGQALISNSLTKILFPNPAAEIEAYRDHLHCTEGELAAVREGMAASARGTFLVKRDSGSFIAQADLAAHPDHIAILSANPRRRALAERIMAETGTDPTLWVPEYRRRFREADA